MRSFFFLLLLPLASDAQEGKNFKLQADLQLKQRPDKIYISYANGDNAVRDSLQPQSSQFTYSGTIAEPTIASLRLTYPKAEGEARARTESLLLFLEPGTTTLKVKDTITAQTVTGNKTHSTYQALVAAQKPYRDQERQLYDQYSLAAKEKNTAEQDRILARRDSLNEAMLEKVNKPFLKANAASPVAVFALTQIAGYDIDADKMEPLYNLLAPEAKKLKTATDFAEQLEIAKKTGIGKTAPDFTQEDTSGVAVSLSNFRGKYVLVDFWASWCGPCRVENPNVVAVFNQYKDKGFTVPGVSLDRQGQKERWMKAIHDDKLTWTHVSDLQFWNNAVAQQYGIKAIPMNLLIDPQGKIIAKNIRGEELGATVEKAVSGKTL